MFSLITSDTTYSKDLLLAAKDVIDTKMIQYTDFPSALKEIIYTNLE